MDAVESTVLKTAFDSPVSLELSAEERSVDGFSRVHTDTLRLALNLFYLTSLFECGIE